VRSFAERVTTTAVVPSAGNDEVARSVIKSRRT
jgi:hypothetical protein